MRAADLIVILAELDPDAEIVVVDGEGFWPVTKVEPHGSGWLLSG